jgi:hypothetical protein
MVLLLVVGLVVWIVGEIRDVADPGGAEHPETEQFQHDLNATQPGETRKVKITWH